MSLTSDNRHFAGIVLKADGFAGDEALQNTDDDFSLVLFVRKYQFGKLSMYGTAASALKPPHGDLPGLSSFRPYNPSNTVIVFQIAAAFGAG